MKIGLILLGIASVTLAGCATSRSTYLPDGSKGFAINCDGAALNWNMCYEKAGQICAEKGYDVVKQEGEGTPTLSGTQYGVFAGSIVHRSLIIRCKEVDKK